MEAAAKILPFVDKGLDDADKLHDLEPGLRELANISTLQLLIIEGLLAPQANKGGLAPDDRVTLSLSREQYDALDYTAAKIASVARELDQALRDG